MVIKKILIVRQHNQFGDLLANVPLFKALKSGFPDCQISIIVSPANKSAVEHCKYITEYFVFDKKKILKTAYLKDFIKFLNKGTDLVIVPVTVSLSFTSNLISRIAKAKYRIGPASLDGKINKQDYFFNKSVHLDWRKYANAHVSDFAIDIIRPMGISYNDFKSDISFDQDDLNLAENFISTNFKSNSKIIGIHPGAGKPQNRWAVT